MPQAAGPIAFALVALSLTGDAKGGAAMMLAMTLAQVAGAIPIVRLGQRLPVATALKLLVVVRTLALAGVAACATYDAPFAWLVVLAAVAGSVNGAAFGYLRALLTQLAPPERLPRALGIAAPVNEATFVLAPVAASGLGTVSPVFAVLALAALGAVPALLVPHAGTIRTGCAAPAAGAQPTDAAVAAVRLAGNAASLDRDRRRRAGPELRLPAGPGDPVHRAAVRASVAGGIWVSVRNRMTTRTVVVLQLAVKIGHRSRGAQPSVVDHRRDRPDRLGPGAALDLLLADPRQAGAAWARAEVFALRTASASGVASPARC